MQLRIYKETLLSILNRTINDIEKANSEVEDDPFPAPEYQTQEQYEKFLEGLGIEDLLLRLKHIVSLLNG